MQVTGERQVSFGEQLRLQQKIADCDTTRKGKLSATGRKIGGKNKLSELERVIFQRDLGVLMGKKTRKQRKDNEGEEGERKVPLVTGEWSVTKKAEK